MVKKLPSMVSAFSDSLENYSSLVGVAVADATERSSSSRRRRRRYFSAFSPRLQHSSHSSSYFSVTTTKTTTSSRTRSNSHPRFSSATATTQEHTPSIFAKKKISLFPSSSTKSLFATFAYPRCRISRAWRNPGVTSALRTVRSLVFARFRNTFEVQIDGAICTGKRENEKVLRVLLPPEMQHAGKHSRTQKKTKEEEKKAEREQKRTVAREEVGGPSSRSRWCCPSSRLFSKRERTREVNSRAVRI